MSGQDWSIKIELPDDTTLAVFTPDLLGVDPGDPLQAGIPDLISWNNRTGDPHWPWPLQANGQPYPSAEAAKAAKVYLCDEIPAWESSAPAFATSKPPGTIKYICKIHPDEHGSIVVSNT